MASPPTPPGPPSSPGSHAPRVGGSDDILIDIRDGLVVFRVAGVWKYSSRSNQDLPSVLRELTDQAARLTHRADLIREALVALAPKAP